MAPSNGLEYAIIGGGISGLTLAIALHNRGISVKIYEAAHHFGEIGAGVFFTDNATQAMKICHGGIFEAFTKVRTDNASPTKQDVWFDFYNGYDDDTTEEYEFTIRSRLGQGGVHRAHFLDEIMKHAPMDRATFGKRLDGLTKIENDRWRLHFVDGTTAEADAVIGCDGIKSRVRQILYGVDDPRSYPCYTHKYAYRALAPMEKAVAVLGAEKAQNACMHLGDGAHVLTFPINHGATFNAVAFFTSDKDWPDHDRLSKPATRKDALHDFQHWGKEVRSILEFADPDLSVWAIFDLADNPLPAYHKENVCLVGDACHATTPHHGAGAGMCIEDCAVMAELLASHDIHTIKDVEKAFAVFDKVRRPRGNGLVQSSRFMGDVYEWRQKGIGKDLAKIEAEIKRRNDVIFNADVTSMCREAQDLLKAALQSA